MNLTRFIENRFQELRLQESKIEANDPEQFPVFINSNIKAHHWVLSKYRQFLICAFVPVVFVTFWFMKLGLYRKPLPVLLNMARKQKEAEAAAKAAKTPLEIVPQQEQAPIPS
jgi:hypothetical protein